MSADGISINSLRRFTTFVERSFSLEEEKAAEWGREWREILATNAASQRAREARWQSQSEPQRRSDETSEKQRPEDFIVDWDSDSDPDNPANWPWSKIWVHLGLISGLLFIG